MKLTLTNPQGSYDLTGLVSAACWNGDYRQIARTLSVTLLAEDAPDCPVGSAVSFSEDGKALFSGYVFGRTRNTAASTMELTCYDTGIYLKRNQITAKYAGITPESAVAELCGKWGIPVGHVAATGVAVNRIFFGATLYEVMATLYTLAAKVTGKAYHLGFDGTGRFCVTEKEAASPVVLIQPGSNLQDATVGESGENIVNRVEIYDENERLLATKEDAASMTAYGTLQSVLKQAAGEDGAAQAEALLAEFSQPEQKITLQALGDTRCTAGGALMVHEPVTGLYGLYWIDSDTHQWKNGVYTCRLVVRLKAVMSEAEAGGA